MGEAESMVIIIDDDPLYRESSERLVRSVGFSVQSFASASDFLGNRRPDVPSCLVLDVRLPGLSGLDLQQELAEAGVHIPIIFVTGYGDIPMSVRAIKSGAIEFLTKPLKEQELLDAVHAGIERDRVRRQEAKLVAELRERFNSLTPREQEVLAFVITGQVNKQIAYELKLSEMTVKVHRSQVMHKMGARSLVDLVRMADRLGVSATLAQPITTKQ